MRSSEQTWPCGTPRSTHTAFNWRKEPEAPKPLTLQQIRNEKQRQYEAAKAAKKAATRVNQERYIGGGLTNSERAAR